MIEELIQSVRDTVTSTDHWIGEKVVNKHKDDFIKALKAGSLSSADCQKFILVAIDFWDRYIIKEFVGRLLDRKKPIEWAKCGDFVEEMVNHIQTVVEQPKEERKRGIDGGDFFDKFLKMVKTSKHTARVMPKLHAFIKEALERASEEELPVHTLAYSIATEITWKDDMDKTKETFGLIAEAVKANPSIDKGDIKYLMTIPVTLILQAYNTNTKRAKDILPIVTDLVRCLKDEEWMSDDKPDDHNVAYEVLTSLMSDYLYAHHRNTEILKPNMAVIKELWECGDETLERDANNIMTAIAGNAELLGDDSSVMIDRYLSGEDQSTITSFGDLFKEKPELFYERIDALVESMDGMDEWIVSSAMSLFWEMAKVKPEVFTEKHISTFAKYLDSATAVHMAVMTLQPIAEKCPQKIIPHDDKLMETMERLGEQGAHIPNLLVSLAKHDKTKAKKYMVFIWKQSEKAGQMTRMGILWSFRQIGQQTPEILREYKPRLEELKKIPALKETVQGLLDVIEGRSLETLTNEVKEQREDIDDLDERVTTNEQNITDLNEEVEEVKDDVRDVKWDVIKQEARIDDIEEVVEETTEKVEEIDRKTLSHAPSWSRDVARLLNPAQEHDWRLLATRLNYTTDDVKNWATQPDPCLSLLDEWFATHKTREATYAILKALQEINRIDAAMIVENSLKNVEGIVDEDPPELTDPPPIFISYQWAHQPEVKLLNKHLEMAGFQSWMDIGQMGGGDKLFAKIDEGIRAAKVIICCVSEKYAQSPNCNREVNLSVTLGKPIIPLLMEKLSWPPPGTMGPIFSEYLFIRFFQREAEKTKDDRYWPVDKFQELLMQLRYSVVPDDSIISKEYKGWWDPPEEMITIKEKKASEKTKTDKPQTSQTIDSQQAPPSPEVFISYQWGKQPQIKKLYSKLTSLGLTCWLDIMQMGGGDSLYDKIDKGVRGSKVVISCVTTKYSLSANCRREVILADALKKPIVPLLLEKIAWPPEGPMAMVFTQLLYIDFTKPDAEIQNHWKCPQFDELQIKIGNYIPALEPGENKGKPKDPPQASKKSDKSSKPKSEPQTDVKSEIKAEESKNSKSETKGEESTDEKSETKDEKLEKDQQSLEKQNASKQSIRPLDTQSVKSAPLVVSKSACCTIM